MANSVKKQEIREEIIGKEIATLLLSLHIRFDSQSVLPVPRVYNKALLRQLGFLGLHFLSKSINERLHTGTLKMWVFLVPYHRRTRQLTWSLQVPFWFYDMSRTTSFVQLFVYQQISK